MFGIQDDDVLGAAEGGGPSSRDANPVFQLQRMFAFLQESTLSFYDPTPFIKTLK